MAFTLSYLTELNEPLFDGTIIWAGTGKINFPQNLLPANQFEALTTTDIVNPANGVEDIFNPYKQVFDYTPVWRSIQKLVKVREYLASNPGATVKLFLYTQGAGALDSGTSDWILYLKN
ncbi:MAG: hypothetical protein ABI581_01755 [Sediminibacterium sp.]